MGSIIVGAILVAFIAVAVAAMSRDKKNGKSISCGGDCSHCAGHCDEQTKEQNMDKQNQK